MEWNTFGFHMSIQALAVFAQWHVDVFGIWLSMAQCLALLVIGTMSSSVSYWHMCDMHGSRHTLYVFIVWCTPCGGKENKRCCGWDGIMAGHDMSQAHCAKQWLNVTYMCKLHHTLLPCSTTHGTPHAVPET